jgi:hypothetical protein
MTEQEISPEAQKQLQKAVGDALEKPKQAQGFLGGIPDLSATGGAKDKILGVVDTVLGAIDTIQQYSWIIPAKYVDGVQKFEDALRKVRGWLD